MLADIEQYELFYDLYPSFSIDILDWKLDSVITVSL